MALNHALALQTLETVVPPLKPVTLQDVEEFAAQPDQTQVTKQEQQQENGLYNQEQYFHLFSLPGTRIE